MITPLESTFRHAAWAARRNKVFTALKSTGQTENRLNSFAQCGSALFVQVPIGGGDARLTCNACHDRFCEQCGRRRSMVIRAAIDGIVKDREIRFITLTQRASSTPLKDQIDHLYRNFSVLRRRKFWKEHVTGGAAFLEVKLNLASGLWHPHLHILCEGKFVHQAELSKEWHTVTTHSFIVDVRSCLDKKSRAIYVTKYVTKPASFEAFKDPAKLEELVRSLKGRRLCMTFGTWRGVPLDPEVPPDGEWKSAGSLEDVMQRAIGGCLVSLGTLVNLASRYPTFPTVVDFFDRHRPPPKPPDLRLL